MSDDEIKTIRLDVLVGVVLILLPFVAFASLLLNDVVVPVIGSPFVAIIMWVVGVYLLMHKPKPQKEK